MVIGKAVHAVCRDHVPIACAPERHRVDECLAHDDLAVRRERRAVPYAAQRRAEIQVPRLVLRQFVVRRRASAVQLPYPAAIVVVLTEHRHDHAPAQLLVARRAQHAQPAQLLAHRLSRHGVLFREPVRQRRVRVTQPEPLDQLRVVQPTARQIRLPLRVRALAQVLRDDAVSATPLNITWCNLHHVAKPCPAWLSGRSTASGFACYRFPCTAANPIPEGLQPDRHGFWYVRHVCAISRGDFDDDPRPAIAQFHGCAGRPAARPTSRNCQRVAPARDRRNSANARRRGRAPLGGEGDFLAAAPSRSPTP